MEVLRELCKRPEIVKDSIWTGRVGKEERALDCSVLFTWCRFIIKNTCLKQLALECVVCLNSVDLQSRIFSLY